MLGTISVQKKDFGLTLMEEFTYQTFKKSSSVHQEGCTYFFPGLMFGPNSSIEFFGQGSYITTFLSSQLFRSAISQLIQLEPHSCLFLSFSHRQLMLYPLVTRPARLSSPSPRLCDTLCSNRTSLWVADRAQGQSENLGLALDNCPSNRVAKTQRYHHCLLNPVPSGLLWLPPHWSACLSLSLLISLFWLPIDCIKMRTTVLAYRTTVLHL